MGIIIREWACGDCGVKFESSDAPEDVVCPQCAAPEPEREFRTAPGIKSPQTGIADREIRNLAADYGLSNITNKDGAPVKSAPAQGPQAPQFATGNPQVMQQLQRLGASGNADSFSSVLPSLQRAGRPHQWQKTRERGK